MIKLQQYRHQYEANNQTPLLLCFFKHVTTFWRTFHYQP